MVERDGRRIREMFGAIAPTYDFLNRLLSLSIDRRWRRITRDLVRDQVRQPGRILDLCTGTADLALEMATLAPVVACDFTHEMLVRGKHKSSRHPTPHPIFFAEGDALRLPFSSKTFQVITIAFGLRNLENYRHGLEEMARVLADEGSLVVLEFARPRSGFFGLLFRAYFRWILPLVGGAVSGRFNSYRYLPESVEGFPEPEHLGRLFRQAGFSTPDCRSLTGGIARIYRTRKEVVRNPQSGQVN